MRGSLGSGRKRLWDASAAGARPSPIPPGFTALRWGAVGAERAEIEHLCLQASAPEWCVGGEAIARPRRRRSVAVAA
eukprot:3689422-Prymnesium_polylepis.1